MDREEFRKRVLKAEGKRKPFKITNSHKLREAWRWLRKHKWLDIGQPVTEKEFSTIIKTIHLSLLDQFVHGKDIVFPHYMGRLELRKRKAKIEIRDGKIYTTLPLDWKRTLDLWYEDKEAMENKTMVRHESKDVYSVYYNRSKAKYVNKGFYRFMPTRTFKLLLKKEINNGLDAFLYDYEVH